MNMEGEGLADVRNYFRKKMVSAGVVKPTEEEMAQMQAEAQNAQPDPQAQYLQAAAEEAAANAENMRANTMLTGIKAEETKAKTEETRAKTIATLASVDQGERAELREERESLAGRGKSSEGTT